jgi:hypothetical protein
MTAADGHPIFVVGAPRTGTTLVRDILNNHARIHLFDEVHFFERVWDDRENLGSLETGESREKAFDRLRGIVRAYGQDQSVADLLTSAEFDRRFAGEGGGYRGLLAALLKSGAELRGAEFWGDSSPQDILYLSTLLSWFPDARIVGLIRDPRGFLCSYKNYHRRGVPSYHERYNPFTNSVLWRSYMSALLEFGSGPCGDSLYALHYEKLVTDPEAEVRALCAHVGVDFEPGMLDVARANSSFVPDPQTGSQRGIVTTSRERWREELTPTEVWLGERIFGKTMIALGYEPESREGNLHPSLPELLRIFALLPPRLFNMLFRSYKPFRLGKVRRVFSSLRGS